MLGRRSCLSSGQVEHLSNFRSGAVVVLSVVLMLWEWSGVQGSRGESAEIEEVLVLWS